MKTWLARFRISSRFDAGKPLSGDGLSGPARMPESRRFAAEAEALDRGLRGGPTPPPIPPFLHDNIMRAVVAAKVGATPRRSSVPWRWVPASAAALVLVGAAWWGMHPAPVAGPLAPASLVLQTGNRVTQTMPAAILAPMADEWQKVNRDLDRTAQFLWASVP